MKPILNLSEITDFDENDDGPFREKFAGISEKVGAKKLGYNIVMLEPGFKSCPFHNHHVNEEMFLVLEGEGTLRFGQQSYPIKKDDIIACPPGGPDVAHQIINTSDYTLKYLCLSTNEAFDVCEYPDSGKVLSVVGNQGERSFSHISKLGDAVDYYDGER